MKFKMVKTLNENDMRYKNKQYLTNNIKKYTRSFPRTEHIYYDIRDYDFWFREILEITYHPVSDGYDFDFYLGHINYNNFDKDSLKEALISGCESFDTPDGLYYKTLNFKLFEKELMRQYDESGIKTEQDTFIGKSVNEYLKKLTSNNDLDTLSQSYIDVYSAVRDFMLHYTTK